MDGKDARQALEARVRWLLAEEQEPNQDGPDGRTDSPKTQTEQALQTGALAAYAYAVCLLHDTDQSAKATQERIAAEVAAEARLIEASA